MGRVRVCGVARLGRWRDPFIRPGSQLADHLSRLWLGNFRAFQSDLDQLAVIYGRRCWPGPGTANQERKVAKVVGRRRIAGNQILRELENWVWQLIRAVDQTVILYIHPGATYLNPNVLDRRKECSAVRPETPPAFLSY